MKLTYLLTLAASLAAAQPTVYLIRHGEKPDDDDQVGLSTKGLKRAQCLRTVFGAGSGYNIGYIMAQAYKPDGSRERPFETVEPVAKDLGLTVDVSCDRDDSKCVKNAVKNYKGSGNILICWEHDALKDIAQKLGAKKVSSYPSDRFDEIWFDPYPYSKITDIISEDCPGLDD